MLGKRLSELRKKRKLRQEDLANKIGIARTTYAMYEQGKREPDYETLQKLADFFEVTTDYLLGRTPNPDLIAETKGNFFYFDKEGLTEEEAELLEQSYKLMRERARKRAEEKNNKK